MRKKSYRDKDTAPFESQGWQLTIFLHKNLNVGQYIHFNQHPVNIPSMNLTPLIFLKYMNMGRGNVKCVCHQRLINIVSF